MDMDVKQLRELLQVNYLYLVQGLTPNEVKQAASKLHARGMIISEEKEYLLLDIHTPTRATEQLIDLLLKKNRRELFLEFLEILRSELRRPDLVAHFDREVVQEATSGTSTGPQVMRKWDYMDMDVKQLRLLLRVNYYKLVARLTLDEVRQAASELYARGMILNEEKECFLLESITPVKTARYLLDMVVKKDSRELYFALLEIIRIDLKRPAIASDLGVFAGDDGGIAHVPYIERSAIYMGKQELGKGAYGRVVLGQWNGQDVAIKVTKKTYPTPANAVARPSEEKLHWSLKHKNIIKLFGICSMPEELYIVMEYAKDGSLRSVLDSHWKFITDDVKVQWALQMAEGMLYLHSENCVHRDLKSMNVLVKESSGAPTDLRYKTIKIADFGLARNNFDATQPLTNKKAVGTLRWMAPEVIRGENFSKASDVWSYGIVLWEIVTGEYPHKSLEDFQIIYAIGNSSCNPEIPSGCNPYFKVLLNKCWNKDHKERTKFTTMVQFLTKVDESSLRNVSAVTYPEEERSMSGQGATQATGMSSGNRLWEEMDVEQLRRNFRRKRVKLVEKLTLEEVKQAATKLYSLELLLKSELEKVHLVGQTPIEAAGTLIGYVETKNWKELYCAFLEILQSEFNREDLVKDLTSLEP